MTDFELTVASIKAKYASSAGENLLFASCKLYYFEEGYTVYTFCESWYLSLCCSLYCCRDIKPM